MLLLSAALHGVNLCLYNERELHLNGEAAVARYHRARAKQRRKATMKKASIYPKSRKKRDRRGREREREKSGHYYFTL